MELSKQIKKHRAMLNLSQEDLAEKIYVTRQTISNWENDKSYPEINSLLLMSSLFDISLDQLIKGDLEIMKEAIKSEDIQKFNYYGNLFTICLIACVLSSVPLAHFFGRVGIAVWVVLSVITLLLSIKVEKLKKENNVQTYKEIVAFTNGERLDEISESREKAKAPYQKILLAIGAAVITLVVSMVLGKLLSIF